MAKLEFSTRRRKHEFASASEKDKDKIRKEYIKQDKKTPYRVFVATSGKPTVHLLTTKEGALEVMRNYEGMTRILMDMRTGNIIEAKRT